MPKKRNEAGRVVVFFQTQQLDTVQAILEICKEIVAARTPKADRKPKKPKKDKSEQPALPGAVN